MCSTVDCIEVRKRILFTWRETYSVQDSCCCTLESIDSDILSFQKEI